MNKKTKKIIWIIGGVLLAGLLLLLLSDMFSFGAKQVSFTEFTNLIIKGTEDDYVKSISCNAFVWELETAKGIRYVTNGPSVHYFADWAAFVESIGGPDVLENITVELSNPNQGSIMDYLFPALSVGIGLILLIVF